MADEQVDGKFAVDVERGDGLKVLGDRLRVMNLWTGLRGKLSKGMLIVDVNIMIR